MGNGRVKLMIGKAIHNLGILKNYEFAVGISMAELAIR